MSHSRINFRIFSPLLSLILFFSLVMIRPTSAAVKENKESKADAPHSTQAAVSISRVVGEAGEQFITSREVRIDDAIDQAVNGKPDEGSEEFRILTGSEKNFPSFVAHVLDNWAVYLEAKSLLTQPPAKSEISRVVKIVQERWGGHADWSALEVGSDELREFVERELVATQFEQLKSDPQLAPVSDDDALQYFKKNRLRFGSLPFSSFKDNIKAFLVKSQTEKRLSEWREVLRRKYKVRNFIAG